MSFLENTRRPDGIGGRMMVSLMNFGHRSLAEWGLRFVDPSANASVLDCGCGGGANIAKLLAQCPAGMVMGIDYADISVQKSREVNRKAIEEGRCAVLRASVTELPFENARFDLVTAFETVYFWPGLTRCFCEVGRVLRENGTFLICNECGGENAKDEKWTEKIDGMQIYTAAQLQAALEAAGFGSVCVHKNKKGWLCVMAQKLPRADRATE